VRAVFVGALVALGVGMVVLEPDNELEDIFLNVAFVPTPDAGWMLQSLELWKPRPALPRRQLLPAPALTGRARLT
jgi:hypothetical protein